MHAKIVHNGSKTKHARIAVRGRTDYRAREHSNRGVCRTRRGTRLSVAAGAEMEPTVVFITGAAHSGTTIAQALLRVQRGVVSPLGMNVEGLPSVRSLTAANVTTAMPSSFLLFKCPCECATRAECHRRPSQYTAERQIAELQKVARVTRLPVNVILMTRDPLDRLLSHVLRDAPNGVNTTSADYLRAQWIRLQRIEDVWRQFLRRRRTDQSGGAGRGGSLEIAVEWLATHPDAFVERALGIARSHYRPLRAKSDQSTRPMQPPVEGPAHARLRRWQQQAGVRASAQRHATESELRAMLTTLLGVGRDLDDAAGDHDAPDARGKSGFAADDTTTTARDLNNHSASPAARFRPARFMHSCVLSRTCR